MISNTAIQRTEKEDLQNAKWEALGRKAGELTKGDIVYHNSKGFGEVVMTQQDKAIVEFVEKGLAQQEPLSNHLLELITPVEYRFDYK